MMHSYQFGTIKSIQGSGSYKLFAAKNEGTVTKILNSRNAEKYTAPNPTSRNVYLEYCSGCHEKGQMGAPRSKNAKDWENF
jgi:cytochrome c5